MLSVRRELNLLYYLRAGFYSISSLTEVPLISALGGIRRGSTTTSSVVGLRTTDVFLSLMILGLVTFNRLLELETLGLGEVSSYFTVMRVMSF